MSDEPKQPDGQFSPVNVIIFPRGQLTQADRNVLTAAGFLAVEADEPSRVVTVLPVVPIITPMSGDEVFRSMLDAVTNNAHAASEFGRAFILRLKGKTA